MFMMPSIFGEDLFDDFFAPEFGSAWDEEFPREMEHALAPRHAFGKRARNLMKTDVQEANGAYEVSIDLPGFKKEDVHLDLNNGYLTIQAVRTHDNSQKDKDGRYLRQERYSGSCARSFYVGDSVKPQDVNAKFEDGILKLSLPRQEVQKLPEPQHMIEIK